MTVQDLIRSLSSYDPNTEICFTDSNYDGDDFDPDYDHDNVLGNECVLAFARVEYDRAYYSDISEKHYLAISITDFRCTDI